MIRAALVAAFALTGCTITATTEVRVAGGAGPVAPNVAAVPTVASELVGFAHDALLSRASLVQIDGDATCFDLLIRRPVLLPDDRKDIGLKVSVEVDGMPASTYQGGLLACTVGASCLPAESRLQPFVFESDERIRVEGRRICFQKVPIAQHELVLAADPGLAAWRFVFRLDAGG